MRFELATMLEGHDHIEPLPVSMRTRAPKFWRFPGQPAGATRHQYAAWGRPWAASIGPVAFDPALDLRHPPVAASRTRLGYRIGRTRGLTATLSWCPGSVAVLNIAHENASISAHGRNVW